MTTSPPVDVIENMTVIAPSMLVERTAEEFPRGNSLPSEGDLDAAMDRLRAACAAASENLWDVGHELALMQESLWQARRDKFGKPLYKSFKAFVETETHFEIAYATKLVKVAQTFPRAHFAKYGIRKLYTIACAPVEARPKLLARAKRGASAAEIERAARNAIPYDARAPRAERKCSAASKAEPPRATAPATTLSDAEWDALYGDMHEIGDILWKHADMMAKPRADEHAAAVDKRDVYEQMFARAKADGWERYVRVMDLLKRVRPETFEDAVPTSEPSRPEEPAALVETDGEAIERSEVAAAGTLATTVNWLPSWKDAEVAT